MQATAEVASRIQQIADIDRTTDDRSLPQDHRNWATSVLDRLLVSPDGLRIHALLLGRVLDEVRHRDPLPELEARKVLTRGPAALSDTMLIVLFLNLTALNDLYFKIQEELPDYWLDIMAREGAVEAEFMGRTWTA